MSKSNNNLSVTDACEQAIVDWCASMPTQDQMADMADRVHALPAFRKVCAMAIAKGKRRLTEEQRQKKREVFQRNKDMHRAAIDADERRHRMVLKSLLNKLASEV
jgi:hypothetical protein